MMNPKMIKIGQHKIGRPGNLFLIAGPCVLEGKKMALSIARELKSICEALEIPLIFKASFDKANRTSLQSKRGPGIEKGLAVLSEIKEETGLPVISDIHEPAHARKVADVLDLIQIPAFLCRQTDLLIAAGETGIPVNIKKGQFVSPHDMKFAAEKVASTGNTKIMLTERGSFFGYNNLVVDFRSFAIMQQFGYPVVFDGTHSVQLPGGSGGSSSGQREFIETLFRAAVATGCVNGLFFETHPQPERALCDGANMLPLKVVPSLLRSLLALVKCT